MHDDSLADMFERALILPFVAGFCICKFKKKPATAKQKNVSLAGLLPCLNSDIYPSELAGLEGFSCASDMP